ncbi:MAG: tetratricopeptide repeat protein [Candidatus Korobacteraceae bacterium]
MKYKFILLVLICFLIAPVCVARAQAPVETVPTDKNAPPPEDNTANPPRSDAAGPGESSSKETQIDISPPAGDLKDHPGADLDMPSDSGEFSQWNPLKAMKDVEVGDFYFKRENYSAAISRYREALEYKAHDAEATYKLGAALEKSGDLKGAMENYQDYLKILPKGPYAEKSQKGIERLKQKGITASAKPNQPK